MWAWIDGRALLAAGLLIVFAWLLVAYVNGRWAK